MAKSATRKQLKKATEKYKRFIVNNLSPVEESYLTTIKNLEQTVKTAEENAAKHKNGNKCADKLTLKTTKNSTQSAKHKQTPLIITNAEHKHVSLSLNVHKKR